MELSLDNLLSKKSLSPKAILSELIGFSLGKGTGS
jgi:hypothetical protein